MRNSSYKKAHPKILPVVLALMLLSLTGCSFVRQSVAALRSTDHFIPNANDNRVLFEPGAEVYADKIASFLPASIEQVEKNQYRHFDEHVHVYICLSRESFKKYYGADVRAGVLTKLFISPRIFDFGDDIARKYLTHELSHLHLLQQLGIYKTSRLPMWFKEGLATYVSDGGGAHLISREQATASIQAGQYLAPDETGGFVFNRTPSDFGLEPHMFYRQSMMFVTYLALRNKSGFQDFLLDVEKGITLPTALHTAYKKNLEELWREFLDEINKKS